MTTTTKTRPAAQDLLSDLKEREAALALARTEAADASRALHAARQLIGGLHAERQHLIHREPELVAHDGKPVDTDNPVALVDRKLGAVPDLELCEQKYAHTKAIADRREQGLTDWIGSRQDQLAAALSPEAERIHAEAEARRLDAARAADAYRAFIQGRWERLTGRRSPALDVAADIARHLGGIGFPEVTR